MGPAFNKTFLLKVFELQKQIEEVSNYCLYCLAAITKYNFFPIPSYIANKPYLVIHVIFLRLEVHLGTV